MELTFKDRLEQLSLEERKLILYRLRNYESNVNEYESEKSVKKIVAYIKPGHNFNMDSFRKYLDERLLGYMKPSSIYLIDEIPLLPNGKLDKKTLKELSVSVCSQQSTETVAPTQQLESDLVDIWEDILNFSPIGILDNYFEIGGDSMTSIRMFWLIEKRMNVKLAPSILFNNPTIQAMARKIESSKVRQSKEFRYVVPYRSIGNKQPLFCIHGGEGHVLFYQKFANYLDARRPVYLVQPKGADGAESLHTSIAQMASDYLEEIIRVQPEGPYNLLYYCCCPLVVEMSNQLSKLHKTANVIIVDSSPKHIENVERDDNSHRYINYFRRFLNRPFTTIKKSFIYRYRRYLEPIYVSLVNDTFQRRQLRIRNRLAELQQGYEWQNFNAKCTLIIGRDGIERFNQKDINSWNHWCVNKVDVLYTPGNHFNIFEDPQVKELGENVELHCL
ncbi:thioesterase domain-containing protein [Arenibacter latericius]|uniref:thioesterase domain-containing protein n=1 Tax=Arenibacter latericius TaxID=86104 RepID=UPI0004147BAF|nr:thioesterase domain-containing protein [Arenibacter latericius]